MDYTIRGIAGGSEIVLRAAGRFAGAFDSLTWNGKEFLDNVDHGRELQSACVYDAQGEANNPTEAGSSADATGLTSTSLLLSATQRDASSLNTRIQAAYWNPVNGVALSDTVIEKRCKIGHTASDYVIEYLTTFVVPKEYAEGQFETLCGYMPPEFSDAWGWNPVTHQMDIMPEGGQQIPVVLSTPNQRFAMGVYSPDEGMFYGSYTAASLKNPVVKWNCGYWAKPCPAGRYHGQCYVVFGTLEDVRVSMIQLQQYFKRFSGNTMFNAYRDELEALAFYPSMSDENLFDKMNYLARDVREQAVHVFGEYEKTMAILTAQKEANRVMRTWELNRDVSGASVLAQFAKLQYTQPPIPPTGEITDFTQMPECANPTSAYMAVSWPQMGTYGYQGGDRSSEVYEYPHSKVASYQAESVIAMLDGIVLLERGGSNDRAQIWYGGRCVFEHPRWTLMLEIHLHTDGWYYATGKDYNATNSPGGWVRSKDKTNWEEWGTASGSDMLLDMCSVGDVLWTAGSAYQDWGYPESRPVVYRNKVPFMTLNRPGDGAWGAVTFKGKAYIGLTGHAGLWCPETGNVIDFPGMMAVHNFVVADDTLFILVSKDASTGGRVYTTKDGLICKQLDGDFSMPLLFRGDVVGKDVYIVGGTWDQGQGGYGATYRSVRG